MNIPYVNLGLQNKLIADGLLAAIEAVLARGDFILGQEVTLFEEAIAARCGSQYAIAVNSGTDALVLTLQALGIGEGDEVLTVPNSFLATASAIVLAGARPVFVDVGWDQNIDPSLIEKKLSSRSKAILPVHLTGRPAQMDCILAIAQRNNLLVIEDCAQAIGARYNNKPVGTFGQAGCFSLHPLKNLGTCGDGGVIITDDNQLYNTLLMTRNHGLKNRDECFCWSLNSRLDTLQAAILNVKLQHLDHWTQRRRDIARFYLECLADLPVRLPCEQRGEFCVYHTFVIQTVCRDELQAFLFENGIDTKIHYPIPIHLQQAAHDLNYHVGDFPVTEQQSREILSLPIYPELTDDQTRYIVDTVRRFFRDSQVKCIQAISVE